MEYKVVKTTLVNATTNLLLPKKIEILSAASQKPKEISLWYLVRNSEELKWRTFIIENTGEPIVFDSRKYIMGFLFTVICDNQTEKHIFELKINPTYLTPLAETYKNDGWKYSTDDTDKLSSENMICPYCNTKGMMYHGFRKYGKYIAIYSCLNPHCNHELTIE